MKKIIVPPYELGNKVPDGLLLHSIEIRFDEQTHQIIAINPFDDTPMAHDILPGDWFETMLPALRIKGYYVCHLNNPAKTKITFKDKGQDFLVWWLDASGHVIDCGPFQRFTWYGVKVYYNMKVGKRPLVHTRFNVDPLWLNYEIETIETL